MPDLHCYPALTALELQHNSITSIADQTCLPDLEILRMSFNQLADVSSLDSLRLLACLTQLSLTGNALEQDSRQVLL